MATRAEQYSKSSRLSYLGTWKTRLKKILLNQQETSNEVLETMKEQLAMEEHRSGSDGENVPSVLHLDVDCFFVNAARVRDPKLRGKKVVVVTGMDSGSEVCTASYEARASGIKKGMLVRDARLADPDLCYVRTTEDLFTLMTQLTASMYSVILAFSPDIHPLSCDDVYIKPPLQSHASLCRAASILQRTITSITACPVSIGVGPTTLIARYATSLSKKNGGNRVTSASLADFLKAGVRSVNGIGRKTAERLTSLGLHTCDDIARNPALLGRSGLGKALETRLRMACSGEETNSLQYGVASFFGDVPSTLSRNLNWAVRPQHAGDLVNTVRDVAKQVIAAMRDIKEACPSVVVRRIGLKLLIRTPNAPEPLKRHGHGKVSPWTASVEGNDIEGLSTTVLVPQYLASKVSHHTPDQVRGVTIWVGLVQSTGKQEATGKITSFFSKVVPTSGGVKEAQEVVQLADEEEQKENLFVPDTDSEGPPLFSDSEESSSVLPETIIIEEAPAVPVPEFMTSTQFFSPPPAPARIVIDADVPVEYSEKRRVNRVASRGPKRHKSEVVTISLL
eukprot:TRINITY_DN7361_c0_g1_i1.p1 TRINITY_DN7361_c0_g1~~TRINITY_DN7361_c0_g1_i1.p1  ORF type:complete len:564 (+),score=128.33 TRINITY_DN7361_c0_g1_i1:257-1948(+)